MLTGCLLESNCRVEYGSISQILNTLYFVDMMAANGYAHRRVLSQGDKRR